MSQNLEKEIAASNPAVPNPSMEVSNSQEEMVFARLNPLLLRVHADDQDKKTICIFWVVLLVALILIVIIAEFAIPQVYEKQDKKFLKTSDSYCVFPQTPLVSGNTLACGNYYSTSKIGQVIFGWGPINQFALQYLEIVPVNLQRQLNLKLQMNISLYDITPVFNKTLQQTTFTVGKLMDTVNSTIQFASNDADKLYASDGKTVLGYQALLAVITRLDNEHFFIEIKFTNTISSSEVASIYSQTYAVSNKFTIYTFALRYAFLALSILALVLYFLRFVRIPKEKKIIEQYFIAAISILLIMFNDPFYPITILKPNGGSAFFSIVFVVNLIVVLFLFWLVAADRIHQDDGQLHTEELTKKKIAYIALLWLELVICTMIYSLHQINESPILTQDFFKKFTVARVIIIVSFIPAILYIGFRYGQICASAEAKLWRSHLFIAFSCIFIIIVFIIICANALIPYYYQGPTIFLVYSFINIYVYYIQYMFTITRQQAEKLDQIMKNGGVQVDHDVLTIGSIDIVDIDLEDRAAKPANPRYQLVEREEQSQEPVAKNKSQFQSFDVQ